jgi:hypothetical protein
MSTSKFERFLSYSGVLAGLLFAAGAVLPKVPQDYHDPHAVAIIHDHATRNIIGAIAMGLFCVAMLFFGTGLRRSLRSAEGGESTYSSVAYAGAVLVAGSQGLAAWLMFASLDAASHKDTGAVNTLSYLGIDNWVPWVAASAALLLATGLGGLRNAVLPRWLAIVTVILGVGCLLGPVGAGVFIVMPLWLIVTSVVLGQRQDAEDRIPAAAMA